MAAIGGEVWFKIDRVPANEVAEINGIQQAPEKTARHLTICAALAPTWVQTCWFALDGLAPSAASRQAYCDFLRPLGRQIAGVHLYGLARPSMQPQAARLTRLPPEALHAFADQIEKETGIRVSISP